MQQRIIKRRRRKANLKGERNTLPKTKSGREKREKEKDQDTLKKEKQDFFFLGKKVLFSKSSYS